MKSKKKTEVDWSALRAKLPTGKSLKDKATRKELFNAIDGNGNGYLSLAEVDNGVRDVLKCPEIFEAKPAINRAFHAAKNVVPTQREDGKIYSSLMKESLKRGEEVHKQGDH